MTGYGRGSAPLADGEVVVEMRAVNNRFLDLRVRLASGLGEQAGVVDEIVRKELTRGRIEVSARLERAQGADVQLDTAKAKAAIAALTQLRDELGSVEPVPLSLLSVVPDLFVTATGPAREVLRDALSAAARRACRDLTEMRKTEGAALARDMRERAQRMRELGARVAPLCGGLADEYRRKLTARVERLLEGSAVAADSGRLEVEVALLADRMDVTEELTRFASHTDQLENLLASPEAALGRKIEFLLQELGREINTIGSKVSDVAVTNVVLDLKAELERLREQVQNVL